MGAVKQSHISAIAVYACCNGFCYASDGERLAVVRPKRPAVALAVGALAMRHQEESFLRDLPDDDYTIVGWLSADWVSVVDENGVRVGKVLPGDSLVPLLADGAAQAPN